MLRNLRGATYQILSNPKVQKAVYSAVPDMAWKTGNYLKRKWRGSQNRRTTKRPRQNWKVGGNTNAGTVNNVRFNDMGDRGGVVSRRYRQRKRLPYRRRKQLKRFRKKVYAAIRKKQTINTLNEFWNDEGAGSSQLTILADTADIFGSTLAQNKQLILGSNSCWGLNHGEATAHTGNILIAAEMGRYLPRIRGADVALDLENQREFNKFFMKRNYIKLTITNYSGTRDLIFDLYQCVAAQDIADADYRNPVIAWQTIREAHRDYTIIDPAIAGQGAGEPWMKGIEPTDCPQFGRYWKILKKESVRIPFATSSFNSYQTFTMFGKPFLYKGDKFNDKHAVKGLTKYFMMVIDPEQSRGTSRYGGTDFCALIKGHRNTHYKTLSNVGGLHAENSAPNWMYRDMSFAV